MNARQIAFCLVRLLARTLRHRVLTPTVLALSVTLTVFFFYVIPSLLPHKQPTFQKGNDNNNDYNNCPLCSSSSSVDDDKLIRTSISTNSSFALSQDGRYHVTVFPRGRLGNQMFEYASLLGIAEANNRDLFVSSSCKVAHYFANISVSDQPVSEWPTLEEQSYAEKDVAFDSLPAGNIKIKGFLQSWKYFANVSEKVKDSFVFYQDVELAVRTLFDNYTKHLTPDDVKIGVHVRRTDMLHRQTQKQGYAPAPLSYIRKAIQHMQVRFANQSTFFFVVSDDVEWCLENLEGNRVRVVDPAPSAVHLGFLSLCDHVIMTVGTFGWWAAYLSGGHVVYYGGYPREGAEIAQGFKKEDFFLPHWVSIGD